MGTLCFVFLKFLKQIQYLTDTPKAFHVQVFVQHHILAFVIARRSRAMKEEITTWKKEENETIIS